ncbi:IS607 family transposase [Hassallia byssoidea VB512170]|uniref:IS607 family transposase n=1 Tax=Hassallia byssoidea VB512170 TaxID=1304833 RepID=A0A846H3U4_9CYAN|nr:IS607 family transposase [Hassalia byssoidea]NEU71688.1 IS607 family transposase [Hassalia byssoidea VB512170]
MKLSDYARKVGISYKTAHRWWKLGQLKGYQLPTGTIIIDEEKPTSVEDRVCIYTRVSSVEAKENLERQADRLTEYAIVKGYKIHKIYKEIGSGLNDNRKMLIKALSDDDYNILLVEHRDRLARFGINYMRILLSKSGKKLEVVNEANNGKDELMEDLVSIITSFCARLYGLRRSKRKTEKIIAELSEKDE